MRIQHQRGYFAIGIESGKNRFNLGTLWRSAYIMGAAFIFTIGRRFPHQSSDTLNTPKHVPLFEYETLDDFTAARPSDCPLIGVELSDSATPLAEFTHPDRAIYLLGAEDHGMSKQAMAKCQRLIVLPGEHSMNVAVAGSLVMADRIMYPHKAKR